MRLSVTAPWPIARRIEREWRRLATGLCFASFGLLALTFGLLSMVVSMLVAGGVFALARSYLITQRESASLTRAILNARSVDSAIAGGELSGVPFDHSHRFEPSAALSA